MKFDRPMVLSSKHELLPTTDAQIIAWLLSVLTINGHLLRDAYPDAHCVEHAAVSAQTAFERLRFGDVDGFRAAGWEGRVKAIRDAVCQAMDLPARYQASRFSVLSAAQPLIVFAVMGMPRDLEHAWRAGFFMQLLGMDTEDAQHEIAEIMDGGSREQMLVRAEKGRQWFSRLHRDDPTPEKLYPNEAIAQAEAERSRDRLLGLLTGQAPTEPSKH